MKYFYKDKIFTTDELLKLLIKDSVIKEAKNEELTLYVYIFDKDKKFVRKGTKYAIKKKEDTISFKFLVTNARGGEEYTKTFNIKKLSTPDKIIPCKYQGAYYEIYYKEREELDYPYLGGTHFVKDWKGQEFYVDGRVIGNRFWGKNDYYSYRNYDKYTCNGVLGERYEIYSLQPLDEKVFEDWQSDQDWFKIAHFKKEMI